VREDVKRTAPINYLYEHADEFPGVSVTNTYLRYYPHGDLAAQVLGYVNEISAAQLKQLQRKGYAAGDKIGEAGVESSYDSYLRGRAGLAQLRVDSLGHPRSPLVTKRPPFEGESIKLTIDSKLQRTAEQAIRDGINQAFLNKHWQADGGAIVALDPRDGSIRAMASYPTYNPSIYTGHVTTKRLAAQGLTPSTAEQRNYPSLDRASNGVYPAGSTFKPVTALAAMETGKLLPSTSLPCTGSYTVYSEFDGSVSQRFFNVDPYIDMPMTLPTALAASCDTWFYRLGYEFYKAPASEGHPLQAWAARFGFGRKTGVDVGPESAGLLPTPEWRKRAYTAKTDPHNWQIDSQWKPGDSIQLAIGQKDLLVTPLQMARFYALIANNGKLVRPHLAMQVEEGGGTPHSPPRVVHTFPASAPQSVGLNPTYLAAVQDGLWQATHASDGTSTSVFGNFPIPIAGKTGTAQKNPNTDQLDQSWWCGYGPVESSTPPELVVCALIENGGFGADAAAPAALQVFKEYFKKQLDSGSVTAQ
jgi:penicillin-binding protein 2